MHRAVTTAIDYCCHWYSSVHSSTTQESHATAHQTGMARRKGKVGLPDLVQTRRALFRRRIKATQGIKIGPSPLDPQLDHDGGALRQAHRHAKGRHDRGDELPLDQCGRCRVAEQDGSGIPCVEDDKDKGKIQSRALEQQTVHRGGPGQGIVEQEILDDGIAYQLIRWWFLRNGRLVMYQKSWKVPSKDGKANPSERLQKYSLLCRRCSLALFLFGRILVVVVEGKRRSGGMSERNHFFGRGATGTAVDAVTYIGRRVHHGGAGLGQ